MPSLRNKIIRLAYQQPQFRDRLLPLVKEADSIEERKQQKTLLNVAKMVSLLAESAYDLVDALAQNEPPEPEWKTRYYNIWKQHYPSNWPDINRLAVSLSSWATRLVRPLLDLHINRQIEEIVNNPYTTKHASVEPVYVAQSLDEFADNIDTLNDLWQKAMPEDREVAAAYKDVWEQNYPRGWGSLDAVVTKLGWADKMIDGYERFAKTYEDRNRYIQAMAKRIATLARTEQIERLTAIAERGA